MMHPTSRGAFKILGKGTVRVETIFIFLPITTMVETLNNMPETEAKQFIKNSKQETQNLQKEVEKNKEKSAKEQLIELFSDLKSKFGDKEVFKNGHFRLQIDREENKLSD
jgi:hypothetical protein